MDPSGALNEKAAGTNLWNTGLNWTQKTFS